MNQELREQYFNWLYDIVYPWDHSEENKDFTFYELARYLHSVDFYSSIDMDENRAMDGVDLRYTFGYEKGYSDQEIITSLERRPCSVFEMMVALADRCERQIMDDIEYGNRTGQWYSKMIKSLGLGSMYNRNFNREYVKSVVDRFLKHDYEPNGSGGLFALRHPTRDMRYVEIWGQLCAFLNEFNE